MPKTLADGRLRLRILTTAPADPEAVTATEANAGIKAECRINKSDFRLSATASDTVDDTELCADSNAVTYGASNYEASMTPFRYIQADGTPDATGDEVWAAVQAKGTTLWLLYSEGKRHTEDFAVGDEYELYEVITDKAQKPGDTAGFIKRVVPMGVQRAWDDGHTIVAGGA